MDLYDILAAEALNGGGGGGDITVEPLSVTENGSYPAPSGKAYSPVTVNVPNPSTGKLTITNTQEYDVTDYAAAQVVDADLVAENIKKDVNILGITGTFEGGGATEPYIEETYNASGELIAVTLHGYTSIRDSMYNGFLKLAQVNLPNSVITIGNDSFRACRALELNSLPTELETIHSYAFSTCDHLNITKIPSKVAMLDGFCFSKCTGLNEITFEGTPTTIYSTAFDRCTNLLIINVPWAEGAVSGAPWGATNATINYNYTGE